jgi:hypothetical protein
MGILKAGFGKNGRISTDGCKRRWSCYSPMCDMGLYAHVKMYGVEKPLKKTYLQVRRLWDSNPILQDCKENTLRAGPSRLVTIDHTGCK